MATEEYYDLDTDNDDLDEDIERLNIVLQDDDDGQETESDGELQSLEQNDDIFTTSLASRPSTGSDITASSLPTTSIGTEVEDIGFRIDSGTISAETCLEINRAYQEVLLDCLRHIKLSMEENRKRQKELEEELDEMSNKGGRTKDDLSSSYLANISIPYFKDKDGNNPPFNEDVKLKEQLHEDKQEVKPKLPWSKRARSKMLNAVSMDSLEKLVRPFLNKLEVEMSKLQACKNQEEIDECTARIENIQETIQEKQKTPLNELLEMVDTDKIDFMKISVVEFDGKYDAFDCELIWRNVLHPQINRSKWTKEEEEKLYDLAEKHKFRNWDKIAAELETHRTPFQCLQHHQQKRMPYEISEWTPEEDEFLKEVVEACKYGKGKIHWNQVAYYISGRTKDMCEKRWIKINPEVKKGRWIEEEDVQLMAAVRMYGANDWLRVASHMPCRTANQCRERWNSSLTPNLVFRPWSYEEDKELMQLYNNYGKMWSKIAREMPGRSDSMCSARYGKLMRWKAANEEFFKQPLSVQRDLINAHFEIEEDHKVITLKSVTKKRNKRKFQNRKILRHANGENSSDEDYNPNSVEVIDKMGKQWEFFAAKNSIHLVDYEKLLEDTVNGGLVVPRPPPLKNCSVRSFAKTWERRRQLQSLVEMQVFNTIQKVQNEGNVDTSTILSHVSETLTPYLKATDKQKKSLIAGVMQGRKPHELTVREMLDISRTIANSGPPECVNLRLRPENKRKLSDLDWPSSDDDEEDEEEEVGQLRGKPPKEQTDEQRAKIRSRTYKIQQHKIFEDQLRNVVASKLHVNVPPGRYKTGRRKTYSMYPMSSFSKKYEDRADEKKMGRKSMALMMKTLDMDTEATYSMAVKSQQRVTSMGILNSAIMPAGRTRRHHAMKRHANEADAKLNEDCEEVIALRKELGIKNTVDQMVVVKEEPLSECEGEGYEQMTSVGMSTGTEPVTGTSMDSRDRVVCKDETYDKQLPFIPPNVKNLHGIRTLMQEHRCLVDAAERYFDREDLKNRLYDIKNKGKTNPFLHVLGNMGRIRGTHMQKQTLIDQQPQKPIKVLRDVKKTKAFKQLQARFQAIFSWPALMSTIKPPRDNTLLPASLVEPEAAPEAASGAGTASENEITDKKVLITDVTAAENNAVTAGVNTATDTAETSTEEDSKYLENLTEEEAIEKLVEKIWKEYKETRNSKRFRPHRRSSSELVRNAVYTRERIKILRRLGLLEKMQGFERQRLEKRLEEQALNQGSDEISAAGSASSSTVASATVAASSTTTSSIGVQSFPSAGSPTDISLSSANSSSAASTSFVSSPCSTPTLTVKMEPVKVEPGISDEPSHPERRRPGRPKGSKNNATLLNSQDGSAARKSSRSVKMPVILTDFKSKELLNVSPPIKRKANTVDVFKKRLKKMIPEKLNDIVPFIPDLPILSEPQPCPKKKRGPRSKKSKTVKIQGHENVNQYEEISSTGKEMKRYSEISDRNSICDPAESCAEEGIVSPSINSMSGQGNSHIFSDQNTGQNTSNQTGFPDNNNFEICLRVDVNDTEDRMYIRAASTNSPSKTHVDKSANEEPGNTGREDSTAGPSEVKSKRATSKRNMAKKGSGNRKDHVYCHEKKSDNTQTVVSSNTQTVVRSKDILSRLRNKVIASADTKVDAASCSRRESMGAMDEANSPADEDHTAAISLVALGQNKRSKQNDTVNLEIDSAVPDVPVYVLDTTRGNIAYPEESGDKENDNVTHDQFDGNAEENLSNDAIHSSNHASAQISEEGVSLSNPKDSTASMDSEDDGSVLDLSMKKMDTDQSEAKESHDIAPVILPSSLFPGGDMASMFVAVPVMMGNVKQMACMPVVRNKDGEFTLPFEDPDAASKYPGLNLRGTSVPTLPVSSASVSTSASVSASTSESASASTSDTTK